MKQDLFLLGDADDVRKKIQGLLLSGDLETLKAVSAAMSRYIAELGASIEDAFAADLIFCGGDELLARVSFDSFDEVKLRDLMTRFRERTGVTISFGVGRSAEEAFISLSRAKSAGPGSLFSAGVKLAAIPANRANG